MTPQQVDLVKTTWAKVEPIAEQAAELFYGKLFELDPALKTLFPNDMKEQGKKLMQMRVSAWCLSQGRKIVSVRAMT